MSLSDDVNKAVTDARFRRLPEPLNDVITWFADQRDTRAPAWALFVCLVIGMALGWFVKTVCMQNEACTARLCSDGKHARVIGGECSCLVEPISKEGAENGH